MAQRRVTSPDNSIPSPKKCIFALITLLKRWAMRYDRKRWRLWRERQCVWSGSSGLTAWLSTWVWRWQALWRCSRSLIYSFLIMNSNRLLSLMDYKYVLCDYLSILLLPNSLLKVQEWLSIVEFYSSCGRLASFQSLLIMERDKGKLPYNEALCSMASQASKNVTNTKPNVNPEVTLSVTNTKGSSSPKLRPPGEKSKTKITIDSKSLFAKLASARDNARKTKELTLMGCLIGKFMEFPKNFTKLKMDWRFIKGDIQFHDLNRGWFEIILSNPIDLAKIWENRPCHIGGQLLLLKTWSVSFDPLTEPVSTLDLWIRIFKLSNEYKNPEALEAILEANNFGKLIRIDPIHLKRKWVKFVRLCVNTNVEYSTGQKLIIPDENMVERKFNVWFDDFPVGCGNYGEVDHVFNSCPDKAPIPLSITITLKKPSSKCPDGADGGGWTKLDSNKGQPSKNPSNPHGHKPYLSENAGIAVIYESDGSSDREPSEIPECEKEESLPAENYGGGGTEIPVTEQGNGASGEVAMLGQMPIFPTYELEEATFNLEEFITTPPPNDEILVGGLGCPSPELVNQLLVNDKIIFEEATPENDIPLFEEEEEDPSEVEEDDPEEMIFAEDLEAFLEEKEEDNMADNVSGNSFHSTHQSMLSSSTMANHLGGLNMNGAQISKSTSSKRKTNEGEDDTTSSNLMGAKKPRH